MGPEGPEYGSEMDVRRTSLTGRSGVHVNVDTHATRGVHFVDTMWRILGRRPRMP